MSIRENIRKIAEYKKSHPEKGALMKKICSALKIRLCYLGISFLYIFIRPELNKEQSDRIINWKWYVYLKRKYRKMLNELPEYKVPENATIPKIIWWCWLQGEEKAPALCRACLNSIRRNMSDYQVNIVTEENMWSFISVPDFIRDKYEKGIIPRTQFSDLLRTCLLIEHGGIWMDSTVLCTGNIPVGLFERQFFIFQNYKRGDESCCLSSWLIAACAAEPSLIMTRDLLFAYWKKTNYLCHYFIYHFFFTMVCEKYPTVLKSLPRYSNLPPHILQFEMFEKFDNIRWKQIKDMSPFHKLNWKYDTKSIDITGTYYEHILTVYGEF